MIVLTATPQPASASVALQITGAAAGAVTITRSDHNGVNPVRARDAQTPIAGSMTVIDAEAALSGDLDYLVTDSTGANVTATATLAGIVGARIGAVQIPQLAVSPPLLTGYNAAQQSGSTFHDPIDRADPITVLAPAGLRTGDLEMWFTDYATARAAESALSGPYLYLARQPDHAGLDMYFAVQQTRLNPLTPSTANGWRFQVVCAYREVRRPAGPLLGSPGWDWDDVAGAYATWSALPPQFATWADLTVGPA